MTDACDTSAEKVSPTAVLRIDHSKICILCKKPKDQDNGLCKIDGHVPDIHNQLKAPTYNPSQKNPRFKHCTPPNTPVYEDFSVFFAGSIEMGKAV